MADEAAQRPVVLFMPLGEKAWRWFHDKDNLTLNRRMEPNVDFRSVESIHQAIKVFRNEKPYCVIVTNDTINQTGLRHHILRNLLVKYVQEGGTLVLCVGLECYFRSRLNRFFTYTKIDHLFSQYQMISRMDHHFEHCWGLDWRLDRSRRPHICLPRRVLINREAQVPSDMSGFPEAYIHYPIFLDKVPMGQRVYKWDGEQQIRPGEIVRDHLTSVACAKVGEGKFWYIGDVHGSHERLELILLMAGLRWTPEPEWPTRPRE